jgi:uncharacterized protein YpuA (DUF1002 family)
VSRALERRLAAVEALCFNSSRVAALVRRIRRTSKEIEGLSKDDLKKYSDHLVGFMDYNTATRAEASEIMSAISKYSRDSDLQSQEGRLRETLRPLLITVVRDFRHFYTADQEKEVMSRVSALRRALMTQAAQRPDEPRS